MDFIKIPKFKPKVNRELNSTEEINLIKLVTCYFFQLWAPASPVRVDGLGSNPGTRDSDLVCSGCLKRSRVKPWIAGDSLSCSLSLSRLPPSSRGAQRRLIDDTVKGRLVLQVKADTGNIIIGTQVTTGLLLLLGEGYSKANMTYTGDLAGHTGDVGHLSLGQRDIRLGRKSEHAGTREQRLASTGLSQSDTAVLEQWPSHLGPSQGDNLQRFRGRSQVLNGSIQTQSPILKDMPQLSLGHLQLGLGRLHVPAVSGHSLHEGVGSLDLLDDYVDNVTIEVERQSTDDDKPNNTNNDDNVLPGVRSFHFDAQTETEDESPIGANESLCDIRSNPHVDQSYVVLFYIQVHSVSSVMGRTLFNPSGRAARQAPICLYCALIDSNALTTQLSLKLSLCFSPTVHF